MAPLPNPKIEKGLEQLNELLAGNSYITGSSRASQEDFNIFLQMQRVPDRSQYPHLCRWYQHIGSLRTHYAGAGGLPPWLHVSAAKGEPAAKKGRAPGKAKQQLAVDCQPLLVQSEEARRILLPNPPELGTAKASLPGSKSNGTYYITTAINYSNGWPHIGHAYEALTADAFSRFHRLLGEDVFFMTGVDEHGQKIAQAAEAAEMTPLQSCDRYCLGFQALNQRLLISNDFFVRTTADRHKAAARTMWERCRKEGDIYLDRYEGWYLVREERFITEQEAQESKYMDPSDPSVPLKKMSEPSFFFRLSKFQEAVLKHIEDNEQFIQPQQYRTEILERLKGVELRDLSISRGTFSWGVSCPEEEVDGQAHVMYVWFEALINYVSGVDGLDPKKPLSRFWPADMHIVGKDISWFHSVIWPAMLMSAGLPLPKSVVVHGFLCDRDGRKMSKSLGNGIDPHDVLDQISCDTLRWYLCREFAYGDDVKFSLESLKLMHNSDLCKNLGNLVQRAVALSGGKVPDCQRGLVALPFNLAELKANSKEHFEKFRLADGAQCAIQACAATNKWIAELEPWKMKEESQQVLKASTCRILLEAVYTLAHFFAPFIPTAAEAIFKKVGMQPRPIPELSDEFMNLKAGSVVTSGSILFQEMEVKAGAATEGAAEAPASKAAGKSGAKEAKGNAAAAKGKV